MFLQRNNDKHLQKNNEARETALKECLAELVSRFGHEPATVVQELVKWARQYGYTREQVERHVRAYANEVQQRKQLQSQVSPEVSFGESIYDYTQSNQPRRIQIHEIEEVEPNYDETAITHVGHQQQYVEHDEFDQMGGNIALAWSMLAAKDGTTVRYLYEYNETPFGVELYFDYDEGMTSVMKLRKFLEDLPVKANIPGGLSLEADQGRLVLLVPFQSNRYYSLTDPDVWQRSFEENPAIPPSIPVGVGRDGLLKLPLDGILIGGQLKAGKTSLLLTSLLSLVMTRPPNVLQVLGVDLAQQELAQLNGSPWLVSRDRGVASRVISTADDAIRMLRAIVKFKEKRIAELSAHKCSSVWEFNRKHPQSPMFSYVVAIDNLSVLADQVNKKEFIPLLLEGAEASSDKGILWLIATGRASADVVHPRLYNCFSSRIALATDERSTKIILGYQNRKRPQLRNGGDALVFHDGQERRVQCLYPDNVESILAEGANWWRQVQLRSKVYFPVQ